MATFNETITLENSRDAGNALDGAIKESQVRRVSCSAIVDSGAWTLVIGPEVQQKLGLRIVGTDELGIANGATVEGLITEPVTIHWNDRLTSQNAYVLPGQEDVLLGALPLEAMDLMLDMTGEKLVGKHGAKPLYRV
jgi:predicted aspartyl protease